MANLIDQPQNQLDNTVKVFDSFYNFDLVVGANEYELVYSYFKESTGNVNTARNFTTMLFRIAAITDEPVLTLLDFLKTVNGKLKMNGIMAYYLNSLKNKATLYGVAQLPKSNAFIQRNVVI